MVLPFERGRTIRFVIEHPAFDLFLKPTKSFRVKAVAGGGTFDLTLDQAGFAQHLEMLADSRLGQGRIPNDVIGDTGLVLG